MSDIDSRRHRWVRHTVQDVSVKRTVPHEVVGEQMMDLFQVVPIIGGECKSVVGCDNCGLDLTAALYAEPCLASLEDQLESPDGEEGL